jgi:hypothetical protein
MPIYTYVCPAGHYNKKLRPVTNADDEVLCEAPDWNKSPPSACNLPSTRQPATPQARAVETSDEYHGMKNVQGIKKMVGDRASEHWRKHELPRLIQEHGKEHAVKEGWIDVDGKPKV